MKTKEQELCALLDVVFDSAQEPDWAHVQELAWRTHNGSWLMTQLFKLMWLCAQDVSAFDEEVWRLTNEAQ